MPKGVRCVVEECVFHDNHNCIAEAIEVCSNGNDVVGTPSGSMCATFRYRDFDDGSIHHHSNAYTH